MNTRASRPSRFSIGRSDAKEKPAVPAGVLLVLLGLVAGCATAIEQQLPTQEVRLSYGQMAIDVTSNVPAIEVRGPNGMPTLKESLTPPADPNPVHWMLTVPFALGVGGAPAAVVGAAYGQLTAGSREAAAASCVELLRSLSRVRFDRLLQERITVRAGEAGLAQLKASCSRAVLVREPGSSRTKIEHVLDASDSLLRISIYEPRFESNGGQRARLEVSVSVRVSRPTTGAELYYGRFDFRGQARTFAEWCASGAAPAQAEIAQCIESISGQIIGEVFLGIPATPNRS